MSKLNVYKRSMYACATLVMALWLLLGHADEDISLILANEPPRLRLLLENAIEIEQSDSNSNNMWQAATLYCEASRFGSLEAQYRLGLLYNAGKGVPKNHKVATTLFSIAARQGHALAIEMLNNPD